MTHDIPTTIPVPEYMHELIKEVTALRGKAQAPFQLTHEMTLAVALNIGLQRYRETLLILQENEPELSALLREQCQ